MNAKVSGLLVAALPVTSVARPVIAAPDKGRGDTKTRTARRKAAKRAG
jgi:starvation-inducible outer membrane lipoprotein